MGILENIRKVQMDVTGDLKNISVSEYNDLKNGDYNFYFDNFHLIYFHKLFHLKNLENLLQKFVFVRLRLHFLQL